MNLLVLGVGGNVSQGILKALVQIMQKARLDLAFLGSEETCCGDPARRTGMDKEIVIYCNTGILAKMAYNTLNEKGYNNVRYLNAVIQVAKDSSYEITEK